MSIGGSCQGGGRRRDLLLVIQHTIDVLRRWQPVHRQVALAQAFVGNLRRDRSRQRGDGIGVQ
jgi:hypothetical protein